MSNDEEREIIDVKEVPLEETPGLPAVIQPEDTHGVPPSIEAVRPQRTDGRDWPHGPKPERRCTAHSSRTGKPCKNAAIKGHHVCRYHGGATKQVKQAARTRLENAADLMAKQLLGIALTADTDSVKLAAIRDALDRAGVRSPSEVVLSQGETKFEQVWDSIGGTESNSPEADHDSYPHPASADFGPRDAGDPAGSTAGPESSHEAPPRHPRPRDFDRETRRQPRECHVTGEDAMRQANAANRAMFGQLALESRHKRYRRP